MGTLLLAPETAAPNRHSSSHTMQDLPGDLAPEEGIDVNGRVHFPLDRLRSVVADQILMFEDV